MAAVMNMNIPPHRKPVPGRAPPAPYSQSPSQYSTSTYAMSNSSAAPPPLRVSPPMPQQQYSHTRRTPSVATSSSSNSANTNTQRNSGTQGNYASSVRRSTSSRSTSTTSPTSYVALMRKQKATVWCDRAQHEDPRILAAQRQAKMRATMEVAGSQQGVGSGRTSTSSSGIAGGMRSKIRHHGAVKASAYNSTAHSGAGVPMRLSATEVEEGDSDEEIRYHQRTGSGRSSLGSGQRVQSGIHRGHSGNSTPSARSPMETKDDSHNQQTPTPNLYGGQADDYFRQAGGQGGSGSSGEGESQFGTASGLPVQQRPRAASVKKTSEELRRRGSVDDRAMTMNTGRLFVANPDLSD
ncbi:hypothetical protein Q7P37_000858 [Cladosporium fusiforme]